MAARTAEVYRAACAQRWALEKYLLRSREPARLIAVLPPASEPHDGAPRGDAGPGGGGADRMTPRHKTTGDEQTTPGGLP